MQALCAHYPDAQKIRVVLDNLSTHSPAALYQSLAVEEARSMTRRLEFHYTPKHASWLNVAEIEGRRWSGSVWDSAWIRSSGSEVKWGK